MKALNFLPEDYGHQKQGTVRLGDATKTFREGEIVWITVGKPNIEKRKIFTAMIDRVLMKTVAQLSRVDLQRENPDMADVDEMRQFLSRLYSTPVTDDDIVTVIAFSEILE